MVDLRHKHVEKKKKHAFVAFGCLREMVFGLKIDRDGHQWSPRPCWTSAPQDAAASLQEDIDELSSDQYQHPLPLMDKKC